MKKIIRLTESDLTRLVKRVIKETQMGGPKITPTENYNNMVNFLKNAGLIGGPQYKKPIVITENPTKKEIYLTYEGRTIIKILITSSTGGVLYLKDTFANRGPLIKFWRNRLGGTVINYSSGGEEDMFGLNLKNPEDFYKDLVKFFSEQAPEKYINQMSANQVYK